ncbi:MAG: PEP/pyruvate-binding domain-containing protein, partial [bacterium]
ALDDFEDRPIIVRSSSLLEDREGSAFSGKYKSLFLANQGTKKERLDALQDAVAEVYSSVFSPDPIQYRAERGLLDVHEEMGILIQEVVGKRVGKYFMPAFSGVAFSSNEFRWSARIKREDGLVRIVPGLGTRAVDRLSDDYPVLISPGQPGLRVNVTPDEVIRYAPKKMDVINLEENRFETVEVKDLLKKYGEEYPSVRRMISIVEGDRVRRPVGLEPDWEKDEFVVTFQGLISDTPFVSHVHALLKLLRDKMGMPVDIECACDGEDYYLLQCRVQSFSETHAPAPIPRDLPREKIVFSANKYVSNGRVPDITHIVYVDPDAYANLGDIESMREVGRAVGALNRVLPKRQFILLGPGRWGSRGDIKLGVSVTYSDINNSSALLEVARKKGG